MILMWESPNLAFCSHINGNILIKGSYSIEIFRLRGPLNLPNSMAGWYFLFIFAWAFWNNFWKIPFVEFWPLIYEKKALCACALEHFFRKFKVRKFSTKGIFQKLFQKVQVKITAVSLNFTNSCDPLEFVLCWYISGNIAALATLQHSLQMYQ